MMLHLHFKLLFIRLSKGSSPACNYNSARSGFKMHSVNTKNESCQTVTSGRAALLCSGFDLHPAGQGEDNTVLSKARHAANQRFPLTRVELGIELLQSLDGFDEPLRFLRRITIWLIRPTTPLRLRSVSSYRLTNAL